ncbi:GDSL-type esterase/lipase family protein [Oceanirhabdus sp. W0125-5]|uniref:GDSL-type esterase/lipase family protein n=1 Tax=Oceanirhabdus sp. W0125-5 TaxID=2999116 RepID=UPI0022F2DEEF|nr:GDSL-type esterase/lipase family protein [Oceanirhabdus sp. W0125-5]WBW97487.1 GDSL-type esterase/lipase family protein [Oceanirhabdus sp. W0125-5]
MNILCLGDSLTAGYGVSLNENWVSIINKNLHPSFINKGINGDTSTGLLMRWEKDVMSTKPSMCFIMIGLNDLMRNTSPESIIKNINIIVKDSFSSGIIPIMLSQPPINIHMASSLWDSYLNYSQILLKQTYLNDLFKDFCSSKNILFIDIFSYFKSICDTENYHSDGIHLNSYGNSQLAEFISQEIQPFL